MSTRQGSSTSAPTSETALALRIERAIRDGGLTLTRARHAAGGGVAAFDEANSRFNHIYGLGLEGPCTPEDLQELVDFMDARGAGRPIVETSPAAHPGAELSLRALGFEIVERLEVLVFRLDRSLREDGHPRFPSAVRVEEVRAPDDATLRAFVELMHVGFNPEQADIPERALQDGLRAGRNEGVDLFVALLNGAKIGAGQAATRDRVTILYGASVLKQYRRRGAQQALMRARVESARNRGSEWAAVFCDRNSATYRNAERLGFLWSYTRLQWKAPER